MLRHSETELDNNNNNNNDERKRSESEYLNAGITAALFKADPAVIYRR